MPKHCKSCDTANKKIAVQGSSYLSALLVILIPKCPFCIMAFSSAITMCGGSHLYFQHNNWVSYLPLVLGLVILALLVLNRRGMRTLWALSLGVLGFLAVLGTHQLLLPSDFYPLGTILLFFAIWLNGNFLSFVHYLQSLVNNANWSWLK